MDNSRIIQLIENPEKLKFSDKNYVEDLITHYPFSQSLHLIYLNWKNRYVSEPLTNEDIKKVSIYTNYRELIKKSIDTNKKLVEPITAEELIDKKEDEILQADNNKFEETIVFENIVSNEFMEEDSSLTHLKAIDSNSEIIKEQKISEDLVNNNNIEIERIEDHSKIQLLLTNGDDKDNKKIFLNNDVSYTNIEKLGISHLFTSSLEKENEENFENKEESTEIEHSEIEEEVKEDLVGNEINEIQLSEPSIENKQEEITLESDKLTFNQWISLSKQKKALKSEKVIPQQEKQNSIISNFIENNPKIKPVAKDTKYSKDVEFKKEEIQDIANLMTITLAQLYVEQGKYDTALTAFKILSLKYPEKSSYFASEIRRIKKIKNSK
ncbi:hypothetical protein G8C41_08505 [Apibacter sp. B3706]|uniref:hypothetical protein n=1 Tax=Apibacter sp. B3706 TaxID=2656760 RepID=UPI001408B8FD|nr:hypothetical protein [Apibacter sp. B3706]QII70848.1 hypothetical protein G8C41_08505 [Apibacter sp. B3706]